MPSTVRLLRRRRNRGTSGSELGFAHAALLAAAGALNTVLVLAGVLRQQADDCVEACATKPPIGGEILDGLAGGEFVGHCAAWSDRLEVVGRRLAAAVRFQVEADSLTIIELLQPRVSGCENPRKGGDEFAEARLDLIGG